MRQNNTSGTRVNNTQTTPRAKKSRTAFYRCHLKANKPLFIWGKIQKSAILFAELKTLCKFVLPSHPISGISENTKRFLGRVLGSLLHPQSWWFGD